MVKLIGGLFVVLACTGIGFYLAKQYSDRPKQIRQWTSALKAIEAEIMYNATPMNQLAKQLGDQMPPPCSYFFKWLDEELKLTTQNLSEAWDKTMALYIPYTALKKKEQESLRQFGQTLGRYNRLEQEKQIHLTLNHLEREEAEARADQAKYEKMWRNLGFLLGVFIVLLLF